MRARAGIDVYGKGIAADYATGRMDDDVLAHHVAFRIKRLLHNERTGVATLGEKRAIAVAEV